MTATIIPTISTPSPQPLTSGANRFKSAALDPTVSNGTLPSSQTHASPRSLRFNRPPSISPPSSNSSMRSDSLPGTPSVDGDSGDDAGDYFQALRHRDAQLGDTPTGSTGAARRGPQSDAFRALVTDRLNPLMTAMQSDITTANTVLHRHGKTTPAARDLYTGTQVVKAMNLRSECTHEQLSAMGMDAGTIANVLKCREQSGAQTIIDACRVLTLAPVADGKFASEAKAVRTALTAYVEQAKRVENGEFSGIRKSWGRDAHRELTALTSGLTALIDAVGHEQVKHQLLQDLAPAMAAALERNGHAVTAEAIAEAMNSEAFGAHAEMIGGDICTFLHMVDKLPELIDANRSTRRNPAPGDSPSDTPATPSPSVPAAPDRAPGAPVFIFSPVVHGGKAEINGNGNGNGWVSDVSGADAAALPPRRTSTAMRDNGETLRKPVRVDIDDGTRDRDDAGRPGWPPSRPTVVPGKANDLRTVSIQELSRASDDDDMGSRNQAPPHMRQNVGQKVVGTTSAPPAGPLYRSYLHDANPGLRPPIPQGGGSKFTINLPSPRDNLHITEGARTFPSRIHAMTSTLTRQPNGKLAPELEARQHVRQVMVEPHVETRRAQITHRGAGAEVDAQKVRVMPDDASPITP